MKIVLLLTLITAGVFLYQADKLMNATENGSFGAILEDIVQKVNADPNSTWKARNYMSYAKKTQTEMQRFFRDLSKKPKRTLPLKEFPESNGSPASFDSRTQWPNCGSITEIRNQANCGSCWAVSSGTALSDRLCIKSGQTDQTRISYQDIVSCCFACGNGCDGGFPSEVYFESQTSGFVSGDGYGNPTGCKPYSIPPTQHGLPNPPPPAPTPVCVRSCQTTQMSYYSDLRISTTGYAIVGESSFKADLSSNGPFVITFTVYQDFMGYQSGVYSHKFGQALGGHDVRLIGYGIENGVYYWLAANTWGTGWGDNGYFKIKRGSNECGIEAEGNSGTY